MLTQGLRHSDLGMFRLLSRRNTLCHVSLVDCIMRDWMKARGSLPALYSTEDRATGRLDLDLVG